MGDGVEKNRATAVEYCLKAADGQDDWARDGANYRLRKCYHGSGEVTESGLKIPDVAPEKGSFSQSYSKLCRGMGKVMAASAIQVAKRLPKATLKKICSDPKIAHTISKIPESQDIARSKRRRKLMYTSGHIKHPEEQGERVFLAMDKIRLYHNTKTGLYTKTWRRKKGLKQFFKNKLGENWRTKWDGFISLEEINSIPEMKSKNSIHVGHVKKGDKHITLDGVGRFLSILKMCQDIGREYSTVKIEVNRFTLTEKEWHMLNEVADEFFHGSDLDAKPREEVGSRYSFWFAVGEGL